MADPTPAPGVAVAYAVRGRALLHVSEVVAGLACRCVCARCGQAMLAKKGAVRRQHFAHAQETDCDGGVEAVLHRLLAELTATLASIRLPEYRYRRSFAVSGHGSITIDRIVAPATRIELDRAYVHQPFGAIVPDVVLGQDGRRCVIELAGDGGVDRAKLRTARRLDLALLQIRLAPEDAGLPREVLREKIENDDASKEWLFDPRQREAEREWIRRRRELLRTARRIRTARESVLKQALQVARRRPLPAWMEAADPPEPDRAAAERTGAERGVESRPEAGVQRNGSRGG